MWEAAEGFAVQISSCELWAACQSPVQILTWIPYLLQTPYYAKYVTEAIFRTASRKYSVSGTTVW
jgi:hypothetical protein